MTAAEASPVEQARRIQAATLAEVREASRVQDARVVAETATPDPAATGTIMPEKPSTVEANDLGVSATFSGHDVESELAVTVGAASKDALRAARAESPGNGAVVSDPVEIVATTAEGEDITSFEPKAVNTRGGGEKGPIVSDVVPGVKLEIEPDKALMKASKVRASSLKIYTRERSGDPWTLLPSYYDAKSRTVRGESDHLSQFVVIGVPFPVPPGPVIVLDPDNDEGHVSTPAPPVTEFGYNRALANGLKTMFENNCQATVTLTNDGSNRMLSRDLRAGIAAAAAPALTLGIGFNTNRGKAWGDPTQGGTQVYSRGEALDQAVSSALVGVLPSYTGRPAKTMPNNGNFPHPEFAGLPGAMTHIEALFMDNNFDRPVIDGAFQHITDGVFTGLGAYLESQGFDCTDPVTGGWPTPPSAAELAKWRDLGHQSYLTYGGDPVSFSTGNLVEDEKLFSVPGVGGSSMDVTLTYNSQDGRLTRVGAGWSFGLGAKAQRFIDGSVLVEGGDGASYVFTSDGHGGYVGETGQHETLTEAGGGLLKLTAVSGESWVFDAGDIDGIGELVSHTDASGNTTVLGYGPANPKVNQFVPLTSITDSAGQTIQVQSDTLGRVTGFTRPGGDKWSLSYDGNGNLTTITLPDGRTRAFSYDATHQLLEAKDATGTLYLKNEYDASGRVVKQWDADGNLRVFDYSSANETVYTDNLGRMSRFAFDDKHRITKVTHPDGTSAAYAFDDQNNVTSVTDEAGRATDYAYDVDGNLTRETAPDGSVAKYTYTPTGDLATVTDAGGASGASRTTAYDYDAAANVTAIHRPDGTTVTNSYDASGNLVAVRQPSGATTSCAYGAAGKLLTMTDPVGGVTRYAYDEAGRMSSQTDPNGNLTLYAWDSGDRLITVTDAAGGVTTYGYDANDHVARVTDPTGAVSTYSWDAMFHLTASTDPTGAVTTFANSAEDALLATVDPLGNTTHFTLDDRDRITKTVDPNGGAWKQSHDATGLITSSTSPSGATTKYSYDDAGRMVEATDPTGAQTTCAYDAVGRLTKTTDADGVATTYAYDELDRVTSTKDGLGERTRYGYDQDGNLTSVTDRNHAVTAYRYDAAGRVTSVTTPLGEITRYSYDPAGNVTSVTDPLGRVTTSAYTPLNLVASVTDPSGATTTFAYDANGRPAKTTDPLGHSSTLAYDAAGRQSSSTDATGAVTAYGYDAAGNQTSMTDALGHVTRYGYDPAAQLTSAIEGFVKGAKPSTAVNVTTRYAYDTDGNLTTVTDPNGHKTASTFDKAGRRLAETNPVGNTTRYAYTAAGRSAAVVNGAGQTTRLSYDKRGDLTRQDLGGQTARYEYDRNQNLIAMVDPTGTTGFVYDADGRQTRQIDQTGGHLTSSYDKAGQLTALTLPTGQSLDYTYDKSGRVTSQTSPWGSLTYRWDAASNITALDRSTGVSTSYGYDAADRVTSILHQTPQPSGDAQPAPSTKPVPVVSKKANGCTTVASYLGDRAAPGAGINKLCKPTNAYLSNRTLPVPANPVADGGSLEFRYTYDADGNVSNAARTITPPTVSSAIGTLAPTASPTQGSASHSKARASAPEAPKPTTQSASYSYDPLGRLAASVSSKGEKNEYGYDAAGNRTSWTHAGGKSAAAAQSASFNDANQLTRTDTTGAGAGGATYDYDGAGNRTRQSVSGTSTSFRYDPTGRTTAVERDGRTNTYAYDGLGRQASSTDATKYGTNTTRTVSSGTSAIQQTDTLHGTTTLVRDAAGSLAEHVTGSGAPTWDLLDGLGSVVAGATGTSITHLASYSDWGVQDFDTTGWSSPEGFTGQAADPTQGLSHFSARSYDPAAATWTAPDTYRGLLTAPQSLARYAYVSDNPATYIDPHGHACARRGSGDGLPLGCGAPPVQAHNNVTMPPQTRRPVPANPPPPVHVVPAKPKAIGPNTKNQVSGRHACPAGKSIYSNPYSESECVSTAALKQRSKNWDSFFSVLGWIGALAGFASLFPGMQWLAPIAFVASAASTIYDCIKGAPDLSDASSA
ncbi:RHS repeat-associated core domain-containing protein [Leifsonia poae]|uniref:RHS repeat-associated core domain-containing protein n=1 Tax=Leifsonia poae TaxID=110933 RepID=UPI003D66DF58